MSKLMELADTYAKANRAEANVLEQGTDGELVEACNETRQARATLQSEIEKVEKDAARYRFWRDRYPVTFAPTEMTPEDVDRATDKAMEATNGQ